MVVDLPAPLGPRKPKTSPAATSKSTPSTATRSSYVFVRALTTTAGFTFRTVVDMTVPDRVHSAVAHLARAGFTDAAGTQTALSSLGLADDEAVVAALAGSADPALAVTALTRIAETADDRTALLAAVVTDEGFRDRLLAVLGASEALGEHLVRHPAQWRLLADAPAVTTRPSRLGLRHRLQGAVTGLVGVEARDALRRSYRQALLVLAARDLTGALEVADVAGELADLAEATLAAALDVAVREHPTESRLAVIGLGKCGGRELNYVSDVDVIFVAEPADPGATALAAAIPRVCSEVTSEGTIWPVDTALRPEGKSGPLVRTLASHETYYRRWAKTWEFQALLKARPVAGDTELGKAYVDTLAPLVWSAAQREGFVADVQAMRRRVVEHVPKAEADREVKLGRGGLRDIEFAVQLLQLVHGRGDPTLRSPTTLVALDALARGGYVGRDDAARLASAYRFLRTVEHRLQLAHLRRTHLLPTDEGDLRRLARAMGYREVESWQRDHDAHTREVRRLHEK